VNCLGSVRTIERRLVKEVKERDGVLPLTFFKRGGGRPARARQVFDAKLSFRARTLAARR
jgi:hypothetical protein